ncbi:unnamed protein product, partial [Mesorhabditis belari]|uniref:Uncharacterized protein n=1 Tax=Mesorhabditis belari TaxID=2138241 RepID=A0AAF3J347_9BILA
MHPNVRRAREDIDRVNRLDNLTELPQKQPTQLLDESKDELLGKPVETTKKSVSSMFSHITERESNLY